jgi:signal transduction histidine kinase
VVSDTRAPLHVLFVEDSEDDAILAVHELKRSGFAPVWERVESGPALREALARRRWQVVLADSSIPSLSALEALALTKSLAPDVPFVVVSGGLSEELLVRAIRSGAVDYVTKHNLHRLAGVVTRELEQARLQRLEPVPEQGARTPELAHRLLLAQEAERRRIACTLHGQFGELLVVLRQTIESARRSRTRLHLREGLALVDQAIQLSRDFSAELWPAVLEDLGLAPALRWLLDNHLRRTGLLGTIEVIDVSRLSGVIEAACFAVARDALANVARHARACHVDVRLEAEDGWIHLTIRDDGLGFVTADAWARAMAGASLGLLSMRERTLLAGGRLEIESAPGQGTTVHASFPASGGAPR